ncbi:MAG: Triose-phosphate Transporter [Icmadophila ericetorum]|nr:Triose-phosphate Transporter [Icmadophila ericetorum]
MDGTSANKSLQRGGLLNNPNGGIQQSDLPEILSNDHKDRSTGIEGQLEADHSAGSMSEEVEMDKMSDDELTDDEETGLTKQDKIKRTEGKKRKTSPDQRVAEDGSTAKSIKKLADFNVLKNSAINAVLIGLWYFFSLSISIYNKWMFSPDHLNFHFPLFTSSLHMLVQFTLASLVLYFMPRFRPRADSLTNPYNHHPQTPPSSQETDEPSKKPLMTKAFYLTRIGPCGAATGLDIGLGNMSLKFISLTFYTMCKSSALAFVLLFAFLFRLETPSIILCLIIFTMTVGVVMMVAGETAFNALGFVLIISSAFFSGFRWALTQILLLRNAATSNPFSSIFFLTPIMFLSLVVLAIPIEGFPALAEGMRELTAQKGPVLGVLLLLFPGTLAFMMSSAEFALLQRTSVVTLSICGIFKEVITISAAGIVFHDPLTPINVSGLLVTIASIAAYNFIKIKKMRKDAREKVKGIEEEVLADATAEEELLAEGEAAADRASIEGQGRQSTSSLLHREPDALGIAIRGSGTWDREGDALVRHSPTKKTTDGELAYSTDSDDDSD